VLLGTATRGEGEMKAVFKLTKREPIARKDISVTVKTVCVVVCQ